MLELNRRGIFLAAEWFAEYPNVPPHLFRPDAMYMVTASTQGRQPLMAEAGRRRLLCLTLFEQACRLGWRLATWAVLPNHYHFLAQAPQDPRTLHALIRSIHSVTGKALNRLDASPGRRVWQNYWDTCVTSEASYIARLHYIGMNPVRHGLVERPEDNPYSGYSRILLNSQPEFMARVFAAPIDRIAVQDDF